MQLLHTFPNGFAWPAPTPEEAARELQERNPEEKFRAKDAAQKETPDETDFLKAFGEPIAFPKTATGHPQHLETYGEDLATVDSFPPNQIWTVVDGDDDLPYLCAGKRLVNRIHYIVTEKPWTTGEETFLWM